MAILDDILAILKGANPSADDTTLKAQAAQLASHPDAPSVMAGLSPSDFDVSTSGGTVTQNGNPASLPSQMPPPAPSNGQNTFPTLLPPAPAATPTPPPPVAPPIMSPKPAAAPTPPVSAPATPPPPADVPAASSDNDKRQALLEAAAHKARMASIPAAIAGVGGAIGNAAQAFGVHPPEGAEKDILDRAHAEEEGAKADIERNISNDPNSEASKSARALVLQIAPQMANQAGFAQMTDQELRDKLPLVDTMMKAKAAEDTKKLSMEQLKAQKEISLGEKNSQFEDRAVNQGLARLASIRGDTSLARAEQQRDAAIVASNRINEVHSKGQELNPIDYTDILGQLYKARSGNTMGEETRKALLQPVGSAQFNRAWTYITGQQAPATTRSISNSILDMANSMGQQADKFHDAYMAPHLVKPAGVSDEAWAPVKATARGLSFADATKQKTPTPGINAGPTHTSAGGYSYTVNP